MTDTLLKQRLAQKGGMRLMLLQRMGERTMQGKDGEFTKYAYRFADKDGEIFFHLATQTEETLGYTGTIPCSEMKEGEWYDAELEEGKYPKLHWYRS